jgi:hypothetical protein
MASQSHDLPGQTFQGLTKLRTELKDPELNKLFLQANYLHQNFYEGILHSEASHL